MDFNSENYCNNISGRGYLILKQTHLFNRLLQKAKDAGLPETYLFAQNPSKPFEVGFHCANTVYDHESVKKFLLAVSPYIKQSKMDFTNSKNEVWKFTLTNGTVRFYPTIYDYDVAHSVNIRPSFEFGPLTTIFTGVDWGIHDSLYNIFIKAPVNVIVPGDYAATVNALNEAINSNASWLYDRNLWFTTKRKSVVLEPYKLNPSHPDYDAYSQWAEPEFNEKFGVRASVQGSLDPIGLSQIPEITIDLEKQFKNYRLDSVLSVNYDSDRCLFIIKGDGELSMNAFAKAFSHLLKHFNSGRFYIDYQDGVSLQCDIASFTMSVSEKKMLVSSVAAETLQPVVKQGPLSIVRGAHDWVLYDATNNIFIRPEEYAYSSGSNAMGNLERALNNKMAWIKDRRNWFEDIDCKKPHMLNPKWTGQSFNTEVNTEVGL